MPPPIPRRTQPSPTYSQLTYPLQNRIHTSAFYPRQLQPTPTTDSEILVYAHDSGIKILWRTRAKVPAVRKRKVSFAANSKGSKGKSRPGRDHAAGDNEEVVVEEEDGLDGEDVFKEECNIHLGTPVHHLAFPPAGVLPSANDDEDEELDPDEITEATILKALPTKLLRSNLVIAATCGDRTIRLIVLPNTPPRGSKAKREQILVLGAGVSGHRELPCDVSITVLPTTTPISTNSFSSDIHPVDKYRPPSTSTAGSDIVIASGAGDKVFIWRINILPPTSRSSAFPNLKLASRPLRLHMHSPVLHLAFNPSPTSVLRRHHLLISDVKGGVRVYDTRTDTWLGSFYSPFPSNRTFCDRRKRILGTQWCVAGRAIVVLCEDGEWGIWDIESALTGDSGAVVAWFSIGGKVSEAWPRLTDTSGREAKRQKIESGETHPIYSRASSSAPNSRKSSSVVTSSSISNSKKSSSSARPFSPAPLVNKVDGEVAVTPIPGSSFFSTPSLISASQRVGLGFGSRGTGIQINDEQLIFRHGDSLLVVPSLKVYCKSTESRRKRKRDEFAENRRIERSEPASAVLSGWRIDGEIVGGVDVVSPPPVLDLGVRGDKDGDEERKKEVVAKVLVAGERRVLVLEVFSNAEVKRNLARETKEVVGTKEKSPKPESLVLKGGKRKRKVGFLEEEGEEANRQMEWE
ncbi:hypothetical protein RUND412_007022 [Rhizina undulata]